jgi:5-methyltetrahydropteroyltriglutamate--homocysteine methyltransferase
MSGRANPPFRADHVSSLLRPPALKSARASFANGEIGAAGLSEIEDREIEKVVNKQREIGLQCATDGEFRRTWRRLDFFKGLAGG